MDPQGSPRGLILLGFTQDTDFVGPLTASQDFPVSGPILYFPREPDSQAHGPLGFTWICIRTTKYSTKILCTKYEVVTPVPHNSE